MVVGAGIPDGPTLAMRFCPVKSPGGSLTLPYTIICIHRVGATLAVARNLSSPETPVYSTPFSIPFVGDGFPVPAITCSIFASVSAHS